MAIAAGTPQYSGSNTAATTSGALTLPTANPGDFMLAIFTLGTTTAQTWSPASGWNSTFVPAPASSSGATNPALLAIFWKIYATGESSPTFSWTTSVRWRGMLLPFTGVNPDNPIDGTMPAMGVASTSSTTSATAASATATYVDDYQVFVTGFRDTVTTNPTATPPLSMTEIAENPAISAPSGVNQSQEVAGLQLTTSGATTAKTATFDNTSQSVAATILLCTRRPAKRPTQARQAVQRVASW